MATGSIMSHNYSRSQSEVLRDLYKFTNRNRQDNWRDSRVNNRYHDTSPQQRESIRFGGQGVGGRCPVRGLNKTFIIALWDTEAEKSFISQEVYRRYFSYRPRQKTKDRVWTAQGAPCCHLGRVEL
ncbi:uncharacterized protein TNCV_3897721 [Trichonephila clavipes]|nr:uncharacterized protein TNCV_3897721 [Trichonephila clavipes]